ncbi:unnamed protein product, partial [Polarella glacialis]
VAVLKPGSAATTTSMLEHRRASGPGIKGHEGQCRQASNDLHQSIYTQIIPDIDDVSHCVDRNNSSNNNNNTNSNTIIKPRTDGGTHQTPSNLAWEVID